MNGCPWLHAHLANILTFFLKHQHLPPKFTQFMISSLVKSKGDDLTDVHKYRAITTSNTITKIFESHFQKYFINIR